MKYVKLFSVWASIVAMLAVLSSSAAADTLTGPSGEATPAIHGVNEGGHIKLSNPIAAIECPATFEGTVTKHEAGKKIHGTFSVFTLGHNGNGCTGGWTWTVVVPGEFSIEYIAPGEGTVFSTGMTIISHRLGVTCNLVTNTTDIGTFTDHTKAANGLGTIDVNGFIPLHSGSSALCGTAPSKAGGSLALTTKLTIHDT